MGSWSIFALCYNMLLGQTGLLSFGHAVYYGPRRLPRRARDERRRQGRHVLAAAHLLPLAGGLARPPLRLSSSAGCVDQARRHRLRDDLARRRRDGRGARADVARLLRRRGGHHANRDELPPLRHHLRAADAGLLPDRRLVPLAAFVMYALTRTPLGRMANAVRDNPERAEFVGYDPHRSASSLSAFRLLRGRRRRAAAINFEIMTFGHGRAPTRAGAADGRYIGGVGAFFGPILGAVVFMLLQIGAQRLTQRGCSTSALCSSSS